MTALMYLLPPILRKLKTDYPQLEINLKAGLTATTLQMLKTNALDLGICAIPIADPAFETVPLFEDELVAILPADLADIPKKVTPAFLSRCPLILGNEESALRRTVAEWLAPAGPPPKPVMESITSEGIEESRGGRSWSFDCSQSVPGRRARRDDEYADIAVEPARKSTGRIRPNAGKARH